MKQTNGYCQIELPDRIGLEALKTDGINLTDDEVKPIIKALNLDQTLVDETGYPSFDNAWLGKPLCVIAYAYTDAHTEGDKKSVYHANIQSEMHVNEQVTITFINSVGMIKQLITMEIKFEDGETGKPVHWSIVIGASRITTTNIE